MRFTPAAASSGCEKDLPRMPTMKFTGGERGAHGAHGGEVRQPGANSTSAPARARRPAGAAPSPQDRRGHEGNSRRALSGKGEGQAACRLRRGGHALHRLRELVDGRALLAARILDRSADKPGIGRQADGFGARFQGMTKAVLKIGRDRRRALTEAMRCAWVRASSRVSHRRASPRSPPPPRSRSPGRQTPSCVMIAAEPPSQTFRMMKAPAAPCSARNLSALSCWLVMRLILRKRCGRMTVSQSPHPPPITVMRRQAPRLLAIALAAYAGVRRCRSPALPPQQRRRAMPGTAARGTRAQAFRRLHQPTALKVVDGRFSNADPATSARTSSAARPPRFARHLRCGARRPGDRAHRRGAQVPCPHHRCLGARRRDPGGRCAGSRPPVPAARGRRQPRQARPCSPSAPTPHSCWPRSPGVRAQAPAAPHHQRTVSPLRGTPGQRAPQAGSTSCSSMCIRYSSPGSAAPPRRPPRSSWSTSRAAGGGLLRSDAGRGDRRADSAASGGYSSAAPGLLL